MFGSSIVALVTPMLATGQIDFEAYRRLIQRQLEAGTEALVVNGTTAEALTLTGAEKVHLLKLALQTVAGRIPIIANTGHPSVAKTVHYTHRAFTEGADACLVVTPCYSRPTQSGLIAYYQAISDQVQGPLLLYNVPQRTGVDLSEQTIATLSYYGRICGLKEAGGSPEKIARLRQLCQDDFLLYAGNDLATVDMMQRGAHGTISVIGNLVPQQQQALCQALQRGEALKVSQYQLALEPLHQALNVATNPIPVKWALAELGLIPPGLRLPLQPLEGQHQAALQHALTALALYGEQHASTCVST